MSSFRNIFAMIVALGVFIHEIKCENKMSSNNRFLNEIDPMFSYLLSRKELGSLIMLSHSNVKLGNTESKLQTNLDTPGMDMADYVKFYLYTRISQDEYQELTVGGNDSLKNSNFDSKKPTFIVIHGYLNDINSEAIQLPKKTLLKTYDCNVIGVDWSRIAVTPFYNIAADETQHVGHYVNTFVRFLITSGSLDVRNTHLVGHSLGAHVAGFTGKSLAPLPLARITGLDPAKPGFTDASADGRLNATDAYYVDCIHTCAGDLGFEVPICQADFYPNGGTNPQPGCLAIDFVGTCSHERSVKLYAESVYPSHEFKASQCSGSGVPDSSGTGCTPSSVLMGQPASKVNQGIFFLKTNGAYPFAETVTNDSYRLHQ